MPKALNLFLNSYGTYLHVKDEMFEIRIPKSKGETTTHQIAAKKIKSIWLSPHTALSSAAVGLALQHHIDLLFLEHHGEPIGRVWHSKLGSTTLIRKRQLVASLDQDAVRYVRSWLSRKLDNQVEFIQSLGKHRKKLRPELSDCSERIGRLARLIENAEADTISEVAEALRGREGTAGRLYFSMLSRALPDPYRFAGRSYRPAKDAFNAMLNYGYGILYGYVERSLILAGIDPYVGFLHRDDYNHRSMVYDFIEPYRGWIELPIFRLFSGKQVRQDHYSSSGSGIGLTKAGKELCAQRIIQALEEERIRYKNRNTTRATILLMEAHTLAAELLGKTSVEIDTLEY